MSLRTFFGGKDDAVTIFKNSLMATVKDGDYAALDQLLRSEIDAPTAILGRALDKTVGTGQLRLAGRLLDAGAQLSAIGMGTARSVVQEEKTEMFRLLSERGMDFALFISTSSNSSDTTYISKLRYMKKDLECSQLREEMSVMKEELTALRKAVPAQTLPAQATPAQDGTPRPPRDDLRL